MRTYYSEFVGHCARYYSRSVINAPSAQPKFKTEAEKRNWLACDLALKGVPEQERDMILTVYSEGDTLPDNIFQLAKKLGINQNKIWEVITAFERKVAKRRGLL